MADPVREAINQRGQQQGYNQNNANEYADLPNNQRAQEIIAEARQRVAAGGGNASMLPQMIQKVTNEFEMRDRTGRHPDDVSGYQQPNNMEAYIDEVLRMSGMLGGGGNPSGGGQAISGGGDTSGIPIPTGRPDEMSDEETAVTDNSDAEQQASSGGMGLLGLAGGAGAGAGLLWLLRQALNRYGSDGVSPADDAMKLLTHQPSEEVLDARTGTTTGNAAVDETIKQIEGPEDQQRITDQSGRHNAGSVETSSTYESSIHAVAAANDAEEAIHNMRQSGLDLSPEQENNIRTSFEQYKAEAQRVLNRNISRGAARMATP